MKVLFAAVIYPGVEKYMDDFCESINNQSTKNFDVLIVNDGAEEFNCRLLDDKYIMLDYKYSKKTPAQIRIDIIKYASEKKYDLLIWGDSDDTFSKSRNESIINSYDERYAFYYNDLYIMGKECRYFTNELPSEVNSGNDLEDYNFVGMSNSAININSIKDIIYQLDENDKINSTNIFDWILYHWISINSLKGKRVSDAITYYRLHDNNILGDVMKIDIESLITKKLEHYEVMNSFILQYTNKVEYYRNLLNSIKNKNFFETYMEEYKKSNETSYFWWENIK